MTVDKKRSDEPFLSEKLPYVSEIDDKTILLRDGDLMASFVVDGIDATTADTVIVDELSRNFSSLVTQCDVNVAFYIHKISHETKPTMPPVGGEDFAAHVDRFWQNYLSNCGLRKRVTMVTLVIRPDRVEGIKSLFTKKAENDIQAGLKDKAQVLDRLVHTFIETLNVAKPRRLTVSSGEWLGLLRSLITGRYAPLNMGLHYFTPIADLLVDTDINFQRDLITIFGSSNENLRFAAVMTLKTYPNKAYAGMFDALRNSFDLVVTHSFTRIDNISALGRISQKIRQRTSSGDASVTDTAELPHAADDVSSGRSVFGDHQANITVFADTEAELDDAVSVVSRAVTQFGGVVFRESGGAQTGFFAQHPGTYTSRTRAAMISSINFAHLGALHGSPSGRPAHKAPWGEAVTLMPTGYGEPYRFNFHVGGNKGDRTTGHTIVLGQTGSGKTLGTAFLLAQAKRLNPRMIIFDKDRGFEMAVRALGGDYSPVRLGEPTGFNPFQAADTVESAAWLAKWMVGLLETGEGTDPLSEAQKEAVSKNVRANYQVQESELKNLSSFRSLFRSTDDGKDLYTRLGKWDADGLYGWLFDGKGKDSLAVDRDIVAFDLSDIFEADEIRTAWLSYIFFRIERIVQDERPTLIVLDEAWKLLDDTYFTKRLKDWMLTMRKKNVAVVLLTQRVSHLKESAAGKVILEQAPTRLVYPSSYNTVEEVAPLNLSTNETEFLLTSNVGNHLVLLKSGEDSVILDFDLGALGGALSVLGGGPGASAPEGWRDREDFWKEVI